ncbi:MAG TPA: dephospho-CoA kinase [Polyangiaceae bacterium]
MAAVSGVSWTLSVGISVFGLTGGIGSGKSTVAARFRERGIPVIDADELARAAVSEADCLSQLRERFGAEMFDSKGQLDRAKLAARVFSDAATLESLNAIVHPKVRELSHQRLRELDASGELLACYEAPLLVEVGLAEQFRPLVVVSTSEAQQIARTVARGGVTESDVLARLAAQLPLEDKLRVADYVIDNQGSLDATRSQADQVLDSICEHFGINPLRYPR